MMLDLYRLGRFAFAAALLLGPAMAAGLPEIVVLTTGGTIASRQDGTGNQPRAALSGEELVAAVPGLGRVAKVRAEEIVRIGSRDMTPAIWLRLMTRAQQLLAKPEVMGLVITHGTDTLEETAYFLDLTIASDKPVVFTAAQRPASDSDSDGPRNLLDAVRVAASADAAGKGVLLVMNGQIHAARDVTKTHTSQVDTFRTLEFGTLGVVDVGAVRFHRSPVHRRTFAVDSSKALGRVEIVYNYAGADGRLLRALLGDTDLGGIVVAGLGIGNVTAGMADAIEAARAKGVPVVIATRVPSGRVFAYSDGRSSARGLQEMGCVLGGNLSPQKARVLLMVALSLTQDPRKIQQMFDE